jgi:predicted amidophosphoribosyltransferase
VIAVTPQLFDISHADAVWQHTQICINFEVEMAFPIKVCVVCQEEFELKPDKPGFANRCPNCSEPESDGDNPAGRMDAVDRKSTAEANEARRNAMRDLLYRKDS